MASLSTNTTINSNQLSPASFTANTYAVTLEYLIPVKLDQNNYVITYKEIFKYRTSRGILTAEHCVVSQSSLM